MRVKPAPAPSWREMGTNLALEAMKRALIHSAATNRHSSLRMHQSIFGSRGEAAARWSRKTCAARAKECSALKKSLGP